MSVHLWAEMVATGGAARIDLLAGYREAGVSRVMGLLLASTKTDEALESLVEDARAAGVEFAGALGSCLRNHPVLLWRHGGAQREAPVPGRMP